MNNQAPNGDSPVHEPYVPANESPHEFTLPAIVTGTLLGMVFGASSLYLLLKVGMTVSASVPIAVLSITLFRVFSKTFGIRRTTILENNIVQTAGSAGESIAFGVGVTMPALLLLGFEMDPIRVMTVSVLGGLLGILMMIPLRRAFIVKQHGKLKYPEGTACAEVLIAGEKGGATARMVFIGFGIAAIYTFVMKSLKLWAGEPGTKLYHEDQGEIKGLNGAQVAGDVSPELVGVGFIIGPRVGCLMMAGAVLSYFVLGPMVARFGATSDSIKKMNPDQIRGQFLLFIGAGAVAAGGIISMFRALPLIFSSIASGLRDLRASRSAGPQASLRTDQDLSLNFVLFGSIALVLIIAAVPQLGLGFSLLGILGALMILVFGFLFVTVSSRLTGEIGSSSNPISGMTIATLLLVCLIFFVLDKRDAPAMLTALTIAAVVCIASSNGGTTSQDLKTGFLVGATPKKQQYAILIGALVSAVAIAGTMLVINEVRTHYTNQGLPKQALKVPPDAPTQRVGRPHGENDTNEYRVVHIRPDDTLNPGVKPPGRYLVDGEDHAKYRTDMPVDRQSDKMDNGAKAEPAYAAPQPQLFSNIIKGILGGKLEWGLVIIGVLIAFSLELAGVSSLPFAVGMYIPLSSSTPIFVGGLLRWLSDKWRGNASEAEADTSPGVLLASGYIAGGTLCGLIIGFLVLLPGDVPKTLDIGHKLFATLNPAWEWDVEQSLGPKILALITYAIIAAILLIVGMRRQKSSNGDAAS